MPLLRDSPFWSTESRSRLDRILRHVPRRYKIRILDTMEMSSFNSMDLTRRLWASGGVSLRRLNVLCCVALLDTAENVPSQSAQKGDQSFVKHTAQSENPGSSDDAKYSSHPQHDTRANCIRNNRLSALV